MTEMEKMLAGEPFDFTAPDVAESLRRRRVNQAHFNAVSFDDGKAYDEALSALIPHRHPTARIMPPFYCDHGHRIQLGEGVFINAGCTFLDCGGIQFQVTESTTNDYEFAIKFLSKIENGFSNNQWFTRRGGQCGWACH